MKGEHNMKYVVVALTLAFAVATTVVSFASLTASPAFAGKKKGGDRKCDDCNN